MFETISHFNENELTDVFKIGYLSNNTLWVLSKLEEESNEQINDEDIETLKEIFIFFQNVEKGKIAIESFQYSGTDSINYSLYWILIKLILISSKNTFDEIKKEINQIQNMIENIIKYLPKEGKISKEELNKEVKNVESFLTILSNNYQKVFLKY